MDDYCRQHEIVVTLERLGTSGAMLEVYQQGPKTGIPVVFCHGFCDLWTVWRAPMAAAAAAGYRTIAPNMRGYGRSVSPEASSEYSTEQVVEDLKGLLDALGIEKAIFVGHDWGSVPVWAMPLLFPERTAAIASVCAAALRGPPSTLADLPPRFNYQQYFAQDDRGPAAREFASDPHRFFTLLNWSGPSAGAFLRRVFDGSVVERGGLFVNEPKDVSHVPTSLQKDELEYLVSTFKRTGFKGALAWYCNWPQNSSFFYSQLIKDPLTPPWRLPVLMVTCGADYVLPPATAAGLEEVCSDLTRGHIELAGHYPQRERPDELNAILIPWLDEIRHRWEVHDGIDQSSL